MINLRTAETLADAESMRLVRNTCRHTMTRFVEELSYEDQQRWFAALDRDRMTPLVAELLCLIENHLTIKVIGYGLVWLPGDAADSTYLTGGLLPEWRGKGHGEQLFRRLIQRAGVPCWLEVRVGNVSAFRLYKKLGFKEVRRRSPQCDGCARKLPLNGGLLHRGAASHDLQTCTAHLYDDAIATMVLSEEPVSS
jgi:ribosomal protein S18 acetylase RimI-like enzyme